MKLTRDRQLDIATGINRKQKKWHNEQIMWSALVEKLSHTIRTNETTAQYRKMSKTEKAEIKDVGGFVGGYLIKGKRSNIKYRDIVCLDIDYGDMSVWENFELLYGNAAAIYSTHTHTPDHPRLRLIIPLNRHVDLEEYQAIARRIAYDLDIDAFDSTTYQPQRLMYWPSTSKDGEYIFRYIDDELINADDVLATYEDWTDVTAWPFSSREAEVIRHDIKIQQDPLEKSGLIGAFCRAYSIHEVIETFIEDYIPCAIENRYTYAKGSTATGIITYDDKFSYSHHGTDPASGVLCNAFDLVRIHKFKDMDEDSKYDTPVNKLPSFKAMEDLIVNDNRVKKELIQSISSEFEKVEEVDVDESEWESKLEITKQGTVSSSYKNIMLILSHDQQLKGKFGFNELSKSEVITGDVPWRKYNRLEENITDNDDANLRIYLENKYKISGKDKIWDSCNSLCHENKYHPIKNYLEALEWDGIKRLDTLLIDYFACEDNRYVRAVTRKTLLAAVTRIYEPGCHFDNMLTLKGPQGCGKSSFFRKLSLGWFTDSIKDIRNKDALEALQGVWIVEMGELTAMKKVDAETIKSFLSGTVDRFRMAYGRRTKNYPRQCIFVATTNESEFLRDKTGNRRFWIVSGSKSKKPDKDVFSITREEIDQIWAETKALYDSGTETLYLDNEIEKEAEQIQESYMMEDPRTSVIYDYLDRLLPKEWDRMDLYDRQVWLESDAVGTDERIKVCAAEVWCEALGYADLKKLNQYETTEINKIIDSRKDWEKQKEPLNFKIYKRKRGFRKVTHHPTRTS